MGRTLEARLAKLEARVLPAPVVPWTPPVFPDEWYEQVVRLLQEYGYWESAVRALPSIPDEETALC